MILGNSDMEYTLGRDDRKLFFSVYIWPKNPDGSYTADKYYDCLGDWLSGDTPPTIKMGASPGGDFRIGTTNSSTLSFSLNNKDGRWDGVDLEGAKLRPWAGVHLQRKGVLSYKLGEPYGSPMGHYYVTRYKKVGSMIAIEANDMMAELDKHVLGDFINATELPQTLHTLITKCCTQLGVHVGFGFHHTREITIPAPADTVAAILGVTVRDLLGMAALLKGGACYFDREEHLTCVEYPSSNQSVVYTYDESNTFEVTPAEQGLKFTGLNRIGKSGEIIKSGNDSGLTLEYPSGPLYKGDENYENMLADKILNAISTRAEVYPFTAKVKSYFGIEPVMDYVRLKYFKPIGREDMGDKLISDVNMKKEENRKRLIEVNTLITGFTWVFNQPSEISCFGESVTSSKQSTPAEKKEARAKRERISLIERIYTVDDSQREFEQLVAISKGLYTSHEVDEHGARIRYEHDHKELRNSNTIWRYTADTSAVSNDGGVTWHGIDSAGNQFANLVSAQKIMAEQVYLGDSTGDNLDGLVTDIRSGNITLTERTNGSIANFTVNPNYLEFNKNGSYRRIQAVPGQNALEFGTSRNDLNTWIDDSGFIYARGAQIDGEFIINKASGGKAKVGEYLDQVDQNARSAYQSAKQAQEAIQVAKISINNSLSVANAAHALARDVQTVAQQAQIASDNALSAINTFLAPGYNANGYPTSRVQGIWAVSVPGHGLALEVKTNYGVHHTYLS